jgi:uncharacterized protein involved in exopolysaccharide biosynthesis
VRFNLSDPKLMRNSARLPSEDIALMSLWPALMRSWLRVLIVAGFAGAAVFAALSLAPARYVASTEIRFPAPAAPGDVASAIEKLRSPDLARKVVADLDLAQLPAFNGAPAMYDIFGWLDRLSGRHARTEPGARNERVLSSFMHSIEIVPSTRENGIIIRVTSRTPELAMRIADDLVARQIKAAERASTSPQADLHTASTSRKASLARDLTAIEAEIQRVKSLSGVSAEDQRRKDLAEAVSQAERERIDAVSRAEAVHALLDKGKVEAIAELQSSPTFHQLIAERVRLEVQKTSAERTLPSGHQRIRDLQARLSELRWQMFREATAIAEMLDAEAKSATAREAEARARLDSADAHADAAPVADASYAQRLAALEDDAAEKRRALESLSADEATAPNVTASAPERSVIPARLSAAHAVAIPAFPRRGQFGLLTAVSILMVGFVAVIIRMLLTSHRRSPAENGFADLAATARDRADIAEMKLDIPPTEARPQDVRSSDARNAAEELTQKSAPLAATMPQFQTAEPGQFVILSTTADSARHLAGRAKGRKGYRTLLVADRIDGATEARDLISTLAVAGRRCVLVDWSRDGRGIAAKLGAATRPGMNELLDGRASFDDVIARLPDSDAHFIAAGGAPADPARPLDTDWINLVLDALDEAYDHIVVVAQTDEARSLFEAIEGRFDAGILMSDRRGQGSTINAGPGVFLGFEVTEIYIVQMDLAQRRSATRRLKRARRQAAA